VQQEAKEKKLDSYLKQVWATVQQLKKPTAGISQVGKRERVGEDMGAKSMTLIRMGKTEVSVEIHRNRETSKGRDKRGTKQNTGG